MFRKYPVVRTTQNLKVPYYVKENFHTEYDGNLKRLEHSVEEELMNFLRHSCYRERNYSKYNCIQNIYKFKIITISINCIKNIYFYNKFERI